MSLEAVPADSHEPAPKPAPRLLARLFQPVADVWQAWNRFWFTPADPLMLGIMRLLTGSMLVYNLLVWGSDFEAFFSWDGLQPYDVIMDFHSGQPVFTFWQYVPEDWLLTAHYASVVVAVLFCLGLGTRVTAIGAFLITISYSQRVPVANFGLDQILGLLCLYLAIGPSGACLSLDALLSRLLRRKDRPPEVPTSVSARVSLRLIQLHLCVIYFWAGFAKLKGDSWWTGEAFWQVLANQEYQTTDLTWMAWVPWLPYLLAHVTVMWEVFFCVLIWNRHLRPILLLIGTGMHFGIGAFLGMWTFGLIMTYAYFSFADPLRWRRMLSRVGLALPLTTEETPRPAHEPDPSSNSSLARPLTKLAKMSLSDASSGSDSSVVAFSTSLLIVARAAGERSSLRKYFRRHDIPCRAVSGVDTALSLLLSDRPEAILLCASGLRSAEVVTCIEDIRDLTDIPLLVVVTPAQQQKAPARLPGRTSLISYPISPRRIREALAQLMFAEHSGEAVVH